MEEMTCASADNPNKIFVVGIKKDDKLQTRKVQVEWTAEGEDNATTVTGGMMTQNILSLFSAREPYLEDETPQDESTSWVLVGRTRDGQDQEIPEQAPIDLNAYSSFTAYPRTAAGR